ncbi:MAG: hypothetical protein RMM53_08305, partial [Bacteroidia bacterium]|nr:hypothetical protein [Bacteroidia bacterium]
MTLEKFFIEKWDDVLPYFERLLKFVPHSYDEFEAWLADMDFVIANIEEEHAWRYIRKSLDTTNENFAQSFEYFLEHILPNVQLYKDKLNRKYMQIPFRKSISKSLKIYDRLIEKEITIFREENVELDTKCNELAAKYMEIYGKKTVDWNGKTLTLQQASDYLYDVNRDVRQKIWMKITDC